MIIMANKFKYLRSILYTIYFNFKYLPIKQAIHLPIILYKPKLLKCEGNIRIEGEVKFGLISLGFYNCSIYPNTGIVWENKGGTVVFKGSCSIGNDSYITIGSGAEVVFGDDFINTASLKLVSVRGITFGEKSRLGWGAMIMDTNFHPLYDLNTNTYKKASGKINIGNFNWFGTNCKVMHSVETPDRCIFGMNSVITRNCEMKSYCVMGGSPVRILSENVIRDYDHDTE